MRICSVGSGRATQGSSRNAEDAERRNIAEKNVNHGHGVKVIDSGVVLVKEEMKPVREHLQLLGLNPKAERMVSTQRLVVEGVDKVASANA